MLPTMKRTAPVFSIFLLILFFISCTKEATLVPLPEPEIKSSYISFNQDTIPVTLPVTTARKENVGSLYATSIEGKLPDSIQRKNNLIIRFTGDSMRAYTNTEIFASYTDSLGVTYANTISDSSNKLIGTKLQKIKQGIVEGSFTIKVSNSTKTRTILLANGKFSTSFEE